jgi:hypothetical protein
MKPNGPVVIMKPPELFGKLIVLCAIFARTYNRKFVMSQPVCTSATLLVGFESSLEWRVYTKFRFDPCWSNKTPSNISFLKKPLVKNINRSTLNDISYAYILHHIKLYNFYLKLLSILCMPPIFNRIQ